MERESGVGLSRLIVFCFCFCIVFMSSVVLLLPTHASGQVTTLQPQTMVQYAVVSASGMLTNHGKKRLHQLPKAVEMVLLLPPQWVSWHAVQLPDIPKSLPASKRKALVAGLLEEQVLSDIGALHFALPEGAGTKGQKNTGDKQPSWVAVMDKARLAQALTELTAAGVDVDRILPILLPTQSPDAQRVLVTGTPETAQLHMADNQGVIHTSLSHFQALMPALHEHTTVLAEPAVVQQAEATLHRPVQLLQSGQLLTQTLSSSWNLAQFDFAVSQHRWVRRVRKSLSSLWGAPQWRWVRRAALALVVINIVCLAAWQWQLKQQAATNSKALIAAFRTAFPEAKGPVPDPVRMASSHLQRLGKKHARLKPSDMEPLLMAAAPILEKLGTDVQLGYADGELTIQSPTLEQQDFAALQSRLETKGYDVQKNGTTWAVRVLDGGAL